MEETDTGQAEAESHRCKACRKPIKPNAKLCPYCHSRQTDTPWHKISVLLQWSAGAVTMVSLIVALNTLTNFYAGWLEKKNTVEELTYAAHWLEQSDNFYYAWNLVDQALHLDPSNARIRQYQIDLAMHWLRSGSTRSNRKASYTELADTVTPVLYRALTSLNDQHAADVFAHIGFAQFLKSRETAVFTDINALFAKALQYDNNNLYANVFRGFWLLFDHQDTHYQEAINHFENALNNHKNNDAQAWINDWYLAGLNLVRDTKSEPINHDVAKRLFALANQMRKSNHPIDNSRIRDNMLRLFGSFRELDTNIEQLLTILPPEEFLQTLHWLAGNSDFEINGAQKTDSQNTVSHKTILPQAMAAQYVMARLNERLGRNDAALPIYKELLNNNPHKRLKQHIVDAYIRITQHPPQEVLARTYMNDPVPSTGDLWQFHADSLLKFDFVWQPHNFTAALDFFAPTPDNPALRGRVTEALQIFAQARDRIKEWIDVRERQLLSGNQHAYLNETDEHISKSNLYKLMVQFGELAYLQADWNTATTAFEDTVTRYGRDDPHLLYALARAYGQQAANAVTEQMKTHNKKAAFNALSAMVDLSIKTKTTIQWEQIKTDQALSALRTTKAYKDLIRGR